MFRRLSVMASASLFTLSFAANAGQKLQIRDFSIARADDNAAVISVVLGHRFDEVIATTIACKNHALSVEEQSKTTVEIAGADAFESREMLNDSPNVQFATQEPLTPPEPYTKLALTIDYVVDGMSEPRSQTIENPLVIIDGKVSNVLAHIETTARKAVSNARVCETAERGTK